MKRMITMSAFFGAALSGVGNAHPLDLLFDSRGGCEAAQAHVNRFDRQNVAGPVFGIQNNGQAQVFFLESFQCEYSQEQGAWHMVNHMGDDSDIGSAWDK
jgi:hypothetical protein